MIVFKSTDNNGISCVFDKIEDLVEEVKTLFDNALPGDTITYERLEMTKEEFEALPEFQGF